MKKHLTDDQIQAYLRNQLPPTEREQLEKTLLDDPEIAEQVALQRAEAAAAELLIAAETRELFLQWQAKKTLPRPVFRGGPLRWAIGGAAGLLLVFVAWQMLRPAAHEPLPGRPAPAQPPSELPAPQAAAPAAQPPVATAPPKPKAPAKSRPQNYPALAQQHLPDPLPSNFRQPAAADSTASIFQTAQRAYGAGDYQQTLNLLAQTDVAQQQSAAFLAAHALFQLGRFGAAAEQFERLIAQNSRQFRFRSEWGLLMCRLADRPRSEKVFQKQWKEMLAQPEHPYFQQAKALRKALGE